MFTTPQTLLARLSNPSDQAAWERFVSLYLPLWRAWVRRQPILQSDGDDLIQDLFLRLRQCLHQFDPARRFRPWMRAIFINLIRQRLRARREVLGGSAADNAVDPLEPQLPGEEEENRQVVNQAMKLIEAEFQPKTWQAFHATVVLGRSILEVARELATTKSAVYVARSRILQRLREELAGHFFD